MGVTLRPYTTEEVPMRMLSMVLALVSLSACGAGEDSGAASYGEMTVQTFTSGVHDVPVGPIWMVHQCAQTSSTGDIRCAPFDPSEFSVENGMIEVGFPDYAEGSGAWIVVATILEPAEVLSFQP